MTIPHTTEALAGDDQPSSFPVVGVGASAGGLEALRDFFRHTSSDSGMAFVVILHLAPDLESNMVALLQQHTALSVMMVTEAVHIEPNHIYVISPANELAMNDGTIQVIEPVLKDGQRAPIDGFFRTLADSHGSRAAAVILSGSGSDGTLGIKRIKESGGTVCVQDPQEAEFDGMPRSAIATGLVDYVLPAAALPDVLHAFWRRGEAIQISSTEPAATDDMEVLREVFAVLRVRTGHDFSQYKRPTVLRRIGRRMQVSGVTDLPTYIALLRSRADEVHALLQDLLISVTNFFRDQSAWAALAALIPRLFEGKTMGDQVRVWVPGCATGEEAYTIAILLQEYAATLEQPPSIQIFATDIDEQALMVARQGVYPETIAGDLSPERLARFFVAEQGQYRVRKELREPVLFAPHNVLRDPPFSRLDLITCRNLLIYLNRDAQEQVIQVFHFSLRPDGYLLLGSSESVDGVPALFAVVDTTYRLFQRRNVPQIMPPPLSGSVQTPTFNVATPSRTERTTGVSSFGELHRNLVVEHAPPSVIVNEEGEIVHLSRGVSRFLLFDEGEPSHNLLQVVHPDLRLDLRTALFTARRQSAPSLAQRVRVALQGNMRLVDIIVEPLAAPEWALGYYLVLFDDAGEAGDLDRVSAANSELLVQDLEAELQRTKEQLRTTIEQYETAVEEQKAANEELQAINEELRAATEELETSKEELQSVNEELSTLNQELRHKVDEVGQANNDLQNLIASTQIGTLFLDRQFRVKRYTPSIQGLFNLIPTDINRPLDHITHTLNYDQFTTDTQQVLATLATISREVQSTQGPWYLVRMLPYRTEDDRIDGVVVTFVDITDRKRAEEALRRSEERQAFLLQLSDALRPLQDPGDIQARASRLLGERLNVERAYYIEVDEEAGIARVEQDWVRGNATSLVGEHRVADFAWSIAILRRGECHVIPNTQNSPLVPEQDRPTSAALQIIASMGAPLIKDGKLVGALCVTDPQPREWTESEVELLREVGERIWAAIERARNEAAFRRSEERLRQALDASEMGTFLYHIDDDRGEPDARMLALFGLPPDGELNLSAALTSIIYPDDRAQYTAAVARATDPTGDGILRDDIRVIFPDGSVHWVAITAQTIFTGEQRQATSMYGVAADITERRRIEEAQRSALDTAQMAQTQAEAALQTRDQFLSIASHELRTPLTSLLGYTGMLLQSMEQQGDATELRLVATIERQAQRLNGLIGTLLEVTRLQQGQFTIDRSPLDLADHSAHVVDDFRLTLRDDETRPTLVFNAPDQPVMVNGDAARLEEVLVNLLSNAVRYSPGGSTIRVSAAQDGDNAILEVDDRGIGIPRVALTQLFQPFFRASNVGRMPSGFGLGLYIVQEIVARHNGRVEVTSAEGEGSTFRIILPLASEGSGIRDQGSGATE